MKVKVKIEKEYAIEITTLVVQAKPRYWEDATVNDIKDIAGKLIPCRTYEIWNPIIDIDAGKILNWTKGIKAKIHYKVCDAGSYYITDRQNTLKFYIEKQPVPSVLCPKENGFGDYIIMDIDENGFIKNWKFEEIHLSEFEKKF